MSLHQDDTEESEMLVSGKIDKERAREVLREVRDRHGREYKKLIWSAWMTGRYEYEGLGKWQCELQLIRNSLGPTFLQNVRYK